MGIDASIYQNIQPVHVDVPSPLDAAQKAMSLSSLGLQQATMARQLQAQMATRQAYANNMGPNGQLNQQGFLSDLARVSPESAMGYQKQFSEMGKATAEAQAAQAESLQKRASIFARSMDYLSGVPGDQRGPVYSQSIKDMKASGVITPDQGIPDDYDPDLFRGLATGAMQHLGRTSKDYLESQSTQAGIGKTQAETAKVPGEIAKGAAETRKALAEAAKAESETYKRNPDTLGQTNDPAKLVPGYVPKEHQAKAFAEIDAAENTKRMSGNIMDSFEQSVKDTQGAGRITSLVKTPRSSQALHQALQPTFKDLEGTVRQAAMDNTFKNVTPSAGDTDADIATKRQALQKYLQSKASAPTARGYGIDLSKYDSTSAYMPPAKKADQGGSSSLGTREANAAPPPIKHGTVEDGYVFMGGDPGVKANWKRAK